MIKIMKLVALKGLKSDSSGWIKVNIPTVIKTCMAVIEENVLYKKIARVSVE